MDSCKSAAEAQTFKGRYRDFVGDAKVADANLGWMTGEPDRKVGARWRRWFDVKHPVFDFDANPDPTPEQLIRAGIDYMKERTMGVATKYEQFEGYEKYVDDAGGWRWRQRDGNNRIIAEGGESYVTEDGVDRAVENVVGESAEAAEGSSE